MAEIIGKHIEALGRPNAKRAECLNGLRAALRWTIYMGVSIDRATSGVVPSIVDPDAGRMIEIHKQIERMNV